jgi:hypothetical protein
MDRKLELHVYTGDVADYGRSISVYWTDNMEAASYVCSPDKSQKYTVNVLMFQHTNFDTDWKTYTGHQLNGIARGGLSYTR